MRDSNEDWNSWKTYLHYIDYSRVMLHNNKRDQHRAVKKYIKWLAKITNPPSI